MSYPQLTFRELRYFMAVASHRSFSQASEFLHISQPSLSMGVRSIENKLNTQLFDRSHKLLALTEKGKVFFHHAERLIEDEQNLYQAMADETGPLRGTVRLAFPPVLGVLYFRSIIRQFCKLYPEVILDIEEYPSDKLASQLLSYQTNIVALIEPVRNKQIRTIPFAREALCLLMNKTHKLAGRPYCSFSDILEERIILLSEGFKINDFINEAFARYGVAPHVTGRTSDPALLLAMVQADIGVTIIPASFSISSTHEGLYSCPLQNPSIEITISLAVLRDKVLSKADEAWLHLSLNAGQPLMSQSHPGNENL